MFNNKNSFQIRIYFNQVRFNYFSILFIRLSPDDNLLSTMFFQRQPSPINSIINISLRVCVCVIINSKLSSAITKWPSSTINDDDDQPKFPVDLYGTYTSHTCTFYTLFPVCLTLFYPSLYHVSLFPYSFLFCPIHYYHYHMFHVIDTLSFYLQTTTNID